MGGGAANRSDLSGPAEGQELLQWWRSSNLGRPAGGGAGAAPGVEEQLTVVSLGGLQEEGKGCASGGGAATLGGLWEEGQELLQRWRSS